MAAKTISLDKVPAKLARAVKPYGIDRDHARAMFWLGLAGDRDIINAIRELTGLEFENARPDGEPVNAVDDETVVLQRLASLLWCDEDGAEAQAKAEHAAIAIAADAETAMQQLMLARGRVAGRA